MLRLCVLSLGLVACGPDVLEPREPTPGVPHFKVATYNVFSEMEGDEPTLATIGATGADVICLQEVTPGWRELIVARYSDQYPYMLFKEHTGASGLGVISRYPLAGGDHLFFRQWHPAWQVSAETPAGWLQLLVIHLRAKFDLRGYDNVLVSYTNWGTDHVLETQSFVQSGIEDAPTVILGDFNEGPEDDAVEYLESIGYDNALPLYHPGQYTWRHASLGDQADDAIDHVLFNHYMAPLNAFVLVKGNSDHIPVVAHLEANGTWPALGHAASDSQALGGD
ncbi:MAG TPA: endonuclease/exonuclease/phosphatase family protein [Polyangiaceae bacterium]|nr:endonuclease/exonuclease/phosphatase family protein [Polyangiaceae bacterium]